MIPLMLLEATDVDQRAKGANTNYTVPRMRCARTTIITGTGRLPF